MSLLSLAGLAASLVLMMLMHTGVLRAVRAVVLAAQPLSGAHVDSCVYHRSSCCLLYTSPSPRDD